MTPRKPRAKITPKTFARLEWDLGLRERKTTADYLATALRFAIYDGQFADDEELNQVELAKFFGVSRVPLREALRQLQAEGLVQAVAHHRTVVTGTTLPEILDALEMRAVLEAHLLRKAAPKIGKADLTKLRRICAACSRIKDYGPNWVLKNWEFHRTLYAHADSPTIVETVERIQLRIERYTRRAGTKERLKAAAKEHHQIVAALERGNVDEAAEVLLSHILHTADVLRRGLPEPADERDAPPEQPAARRSKSIRSPAA